MIRSRGRRELCRPKEGPTIKPYWEIPTRFTPIITWAELLLKSISGKKKKKRQGKKKEMLK
jgi:hypothetical protein